MGIISEEQGRAAIEPMHDDLYTCVNGAWEHWKKKFEPELVHFDARTRASIIHDLIVGEVKTRLGDHSEVQIRKARGRWLLCFAEHSMVVHFKKLDREFRTSNARTETAFKFSHQLPLPGVPEGVRLTVGYRLNAVATELLGVWVVLAVGRKVEWKYEMPAPQTAIVEQLPLGSAATSRERKPLVKPKQGAVPERVESVKQD